ncbi:LysR family transcriptional regulator [Psychromonas aquimarina]|uniref:LysR family transcriptional regulator n=1 Tax=Psychromonas aquimarina TaxID=444919 RepID=UPI0003F4E237|nr:LysR family transcriptional regulator [Psychromonas aquimarina]
MKVFEWDDLRIFLAVLRGRSVRAAAKLMGVSHSTVSRRLQAMESQLGIKLFVRHPEGFVLTEVGEAMVERAERVESEILSMEREIFGRDAALSGPIRISMPPVIAQHLMMPLISGFSALYPDIEIEIDATYEVANLTRRNADIAIRFQSEPEGHLIGHRLPDFANAVYATPEYIDKYKLTAQESTGRWISWERESSRGTLARWQAESAYAGCKAHHCVSDPSSQLQAVKAGMGFAYLFCFMADQESELIRVPSEASLKYIPAWILTHPDLVSTERVRVCVRYLVEAIFKCESLLKGQKIS